MGMLIGNTVLFIVLGLLLGSIFALIPFFCAGLDSNGKFNTLESKIWTGIASLLFLAGFVLVHGIIFGWVK